MKVRDEAALEAEAARKASNERHRKEAEKYQKIADQKNIELSEVRKKLERLRAARKQLKAQIESFEAFKKSVSEIPSKISKEQFKGTLREKFENNVKEVVSNLKTEEVEHYGNKGKLEAKIKELEDKEAQLTDEIAAALSAVDTHMAAIY